MKQQKAYCSFAEGKREILQAVVTISRFDNPKKNFISFLRLKWEISEEKEKFEFKL